MSPEIEQKSPEHWPTLNTVIMVERVLKDIGKVLWKNHVFLITGGGMFHIWSDHSRKKS